MSAELVVATPLLLLLLMLVIQTALWAHATHVANAAAASGLEAARAHGGSAAAGHAQAAHVLARTSPSILTGVSIHAERGPGTARVDIRGQAINLIPGLRFPVTAHAVGVTEQFRPDIP
ncbi:MAG: pilus assembly protein [Sporichthyaceae bacterium]|nr:pilus assembly protein [Sporichthyaceae bacterium]